jgi:hypothetical protein
VAIGWDDDFVVLPDITTDEHDVGEEASEGDDQRLLDDRPPHWG